MTNLPTKQGLAMTLSQLPERVRLLLSQHNQGRRVEAVMRIAEGPAPKEKTKEHARYVDAVALNAYYAETFGLNTFTIIRRLSDLFDKTNEFHKAHPTAMG